MDTEPAELMICANSLHRVAAVGVTKRDALGHWLSGIYLEIIPTTNTWNTMIASVSVLKGRYDAY